MFFESLSYPDFRRIYQSCSSIIPERYTAAELRDVLVERLEKKFPQLAAQVAGLSSRGMQALHEHIRQRRAQESSHAGGEAADPC
jgi:hypothetical protein